MCERIPKQPLTRPEHGPIATDTHSKHWSTAVEEKPTVDFTSAYEMTSLQKKVLKKSGI